MSEDRWPVKWGISGTSWEYSLSQLIYHTALFERFAWEDYEVLKKSGAEAIKRFENKFMALKQEGSDATLKAVKTSPCRCLLRSLCKLFADPIRRDSGVGD